MNLEPPALYKKYHLDRDDDRLDLFRRLVQEYKIESVLYPGCFVHFTPSLMIPRSTYVDSDARAEKLFADLKTLEYITEHKEYGAAPSVAFHRTDYTREFSEQPESFDLLISQYAGFVSESCKRYLRSGGVLLANDSHGDASMASIDPDFELIAIVYRSGEEFRVGDNDLERYFVPKRMIEITPELLHATGKGIAYTKWAAAYVFRRVG